MSEENRVKLQELIKRFKSLNYGIVRTKNKAPVVNNWQFLCSDTSIWAGNLTTAVEAGFVIAKDIVVIDIDPRNFEANKNPLKELSSDIGFDIEKNSNFSTKTASGGFHFYFKKRKGIKLPNAIYKYRGIEFKQKGQQVLLPFSVLPGGRLYEIIKDDLENLKELPQKFYDTIGSKSDNQAIKTGTGFTDNQADINKLRHLLKNTPGAVQGQNGDSATFKVCCLGKDYGLSPDVFFELLLEWNETCEPAWETMELRKKMLNAYSYSGNMAGSSSVENLFSVLDKNFNKELLSKEDAKKQEEEITDWTNELSSSKNGGYFKTLKNAVIFIRNDEHLKDKLAFNQFSGDKIWLKSAFWHGEEQDYTPNGKIFGDVDAIETRYLLNNYNFDIGTNLIFEAITKVANSNSYHPVKKWLENNCESWDGVKRIDNFFHKYCGSDDNEYTAELGRKMFCAIVARIYEPGCKFDYLPIFVGKQGIGKSTLLKILSIHPSWFCDNIGDITNSKEVIPQTRGKLIVEWQELALFSKIDINHSKSFLSTSVDRVREAYHREAKDYPRQFIVVATTNQEKFLLDETGNRRMLPIELREIKCEEVYNDLKQIYAEAIQLYKEGEKLYITNEKAKEIAKEIQFDRFKADEIEETIVDWLDNIPKEGLVINDNCIVHAEKIQVSDIMLHCLRETAIRSKGLATRVGNVLRRIGYESKSYRQDGKVKYGFVKK